MRYRMLLNIVIVLLCLFWFSCHKQVEIPKVTVVIPERVDTPAKEILPSYYDYGQYNLYLIILGDKDSDFWLMSGDKRDSTTLFMKTEP